MYFDQGPFKSQNFSIKNHVELWYIVVSPKGNRETKVAMGDFPSPHLIFRRVSLVES
jgi:hypothetical protein